MSKVLAVVMAVLMLVTMATACKKNDDDINIALNGTNSGIQTGNTNDTGDTGNTGNADNTGDTGNTDDAGDTGNTGNEGNTGDATQNEEVENYDSTKKYDFASNPLFAESKPINTGVELSFDIDTTGFVKNDIKIADLKGKSLTLITMLEEPNFIYRGANGEILGEFTWFDSLKKTYGLNLKYIESRFDKAPQQIVTYMNSGKKLDLIPSHRSAYLKILLLSRGLDPYLNMQYADNSPGIDTRTMEQTKWDDTYRMLSPIGAVDVIWYNQTMVNKLNLTDPHTLWEQGKWDYDAFEAFQLSVPKQSPDGPNKLRPFAISEGDCTAFWPRTNGVNTFEIKTTNGKSSIISNFNDPRCLASWEFFASVYHGTNSVNRQYSEEGASYDLYNNGGCIMRNTAYLMYDFIDNDYANSQKYQWVPFPKGPDGENICMSYGMGMLLPKKTKNEKNIPYAVKFMELWASRFTEAINDYLRMPCYNFSYEDRVEYFKFVTEHNYMGIGSTVFNSLTGADLEYYKKFTWAFYNPNYNITTQAEQLRNLVDKAVEEAVKFAS